MSDPSVGIVDTNVFVHAHTSDAHAEECSRFLAALRNGTQRAALESVVLHVLTYVLPRYTKQMTRADVAAYLLMVLNWPGIEADNDLMIEAVNRWARTQGLSFVDAYLSALAIRRHCPVYTKNVRELAHGGVDVPRVLPGSR